MFHCLLSLLFVVVAITYYLGGYGFGDGACVCKKKLNNLFHYNKIHLSNFKDLEEENEEGLIFCFDNIFKIK
jgi:hypothetical protein